MEASPVTVYSDRLLYQPSSAPVPGREKASSHNAPNTPIEFVRAHAKGAVRFRSFEDDLDEAAMAAIDEFQVYPFGDIEEYCRHIPYASSKKDFYDKTGRESFEVFQYVFKVPGDDKEYHVMWDYNVGLVRMTPFFKCCKYSKTTPAKMLGLNPGLRDITHSITGGSIMAQGYWMPYSCAKAVCATFCCHIAGALIPIFGPDFPSECLPPQSPEYGRMVIPKALVQEATRDTELMRQIALRDSTSAGIKPLPFHRRQSLDPLDYYDHRDYRGVHAQRSHRTHRAVETRYHEAYNLGNQLPPPATQSSYHAHARSEPLNDEYECGPELAPIKYFSLHRGTLLPSPIEHERLPSFSHIASLTSSHHPERSSTTLPPLIIRDDHRHYYQHSGYYNTHNYAPAMESRVDASYPETQRREDTKCLTTDVNMYEDYTRDHGSGAHHQANASEASGHAKQTGWMSGESLGSPPTDYPERPYLWVEHEDSRPVDDAAATTGYRGDAMAEDQGHDGRFVSSSCYPSPPRLPPLVPYESGSLWKRPPHYASRYADSGEVDRARGNMGHRKSVSTSSLPPQRRKHHHQQQQQQQHKASTSGRRKSLKSGNSSTPWNAKDASAAELLIQLGDNGPRQGDYEERIRDSINVKTSYSPRPQLQLQTQTQTRKSTGQRFAASISSLLCDDTTPRKKRRGV
ncbi:apses transcription factor xbp1 [Ophiostoma piceae UAMH 11346]|uniref:Apses transcription factor xbp1 n=1 Tax=Ophiostoma piceae (strain UAMH 11346) TaxID=1262450 RepID=S3BUN9_OPHP1|nr:apses transcription factor xbp1 [Ophiostoma piceae UAMH 11346]